MKIHSPDSLPGSGRVSIYKFQDRFRYSFRNASSTRSEPILVPVLTAGSSAFTGCIFHYDYQHFRKLGQPPRREHDMLRVRSTTRRREMEPALDVLNEGVIDLQEVSYSNPNYGNHS